jgi:GNAT superfamily N-acetyltransferase
MIEYGILTENELSSLLELYKQLIPNDDLTTDAVSKSVWENMKKHDIKHFVARENGKLIASCCLYILPNLTRGGRPIGFIEYVIVNARHKRKGIGKNIMKNAIDYAKEQNCYKAVLQSGNNRTEAHEFYEAIGFDGASKKAFEMRF